MVTDLKREHKKHMAEAKALAAKNGALEAEFLERFFIQGDMEDLSRYSAEEIAFLAHCSFEKFHAPFDGKHRIDITEPAFKADKDAVTNQITIIELHNINKPFLVDSIMGELQQAGLGIHLVLHPIMNVERDSNGEVVAFKERKDVQTNPLLKRESLIHVHISRISDSQKKKDLQKTLDSILDNVDSVVDDWKPMLLRLEETIAILKITPPPLPEGDVTETVEFLRWLVDNNFTLLGMREYTFDSTTEEGDLVRTQRDGLGLLRNPEVRVLRRGNELVTMTPEIRDFLMRPEPLFITKANVKTKVHRRTYMDYIGIKRYDDEGKLTGELRIVGLFTNTAYNRSGHEYPPSCGGRLKASSTWQRSTRPAIQAKQCSTCWKIIHAMNSSRPIVKPCSIIRRKFCVCISVRACGCSPAWINSTVSYPASYSCLATATTPRPA